MLGLLNVRSMISKVDKIYEIISDGLDILVLTESWHGSSDDISLRLGMPSGYSFVDYVRPHDPFHGGIVIYFRSTFKYVQIELPLLKTFEIIALKLFINKANIILLAIYRPGSAPVCSLFFQELVLVLEHVSTLSTYLLLAGDFNVHVERQHDPHTSSLIKIFDMFQLHNWVNEPTHALGGILDLIVSSSNLTISNCKVFPCEIFSDHSFIQASLPFHKKRFARAKKLVRSWNRMDENNFVSLINNSPISQPFDMNDVNQAFALFNSELQSIVDEVAPLHFVYSKYVPSAPWFDDECRKVRRYCRKFERTYRRKACIENKKAWIAALKTKSLLFSEKKNMFWNNLVQINQSHPKKLWNIINKILCRESTDDSSETVNEHAPNDFAVYFRDKVMKVRDQTGGLDIPLFNECCLNQVSRFSSFIVCTDTDVKNVILNSPTKSCSLDCLPTHVFKKYVDLFLPYITCLINMVLASGCFPSPCKHAIVSPLLKKTTLDKKEIKNYRPVSNLSFISKVIERIVARQLLSHLKTNCLLPVYQSGYRQYHSTETALLHVSSELFAAMDDQKMSLLALLDMSAAFDCVDHEILLERLSHRYGISDTVASWFKSYLNGRSAQILYKNKLSDIETVMFGVPQGSVLGPLLFLLYTADVFDLVDDYGFRIHGFADDMQIITSCPAQSFDVVVNKFFCCLSKIDKWMSCNRLKLNQCKTQLLPVGTWQQMSKINLSEIQNEMEGIEFKSVASNLGFVFDNNLSMHEHIRCLTGSCSFQLRKLRLVRKSLNRATSESLVHAFIHSRLDYCNSLFYGVSKKSISMLQSIQNRAAKIVVGGLKYDHVTPILTDLHWLPVDKRILFKIGIFMFKCVNGLAPDYLIDKLTASAAVPRHYQLRSYDLNSFFVPPTRLVIGSRNFAVFGPAVWNSLPELLRQPGLPYVQFRKLYKTFLFSH